MTWDGFGEPQDGIGRYWMVFESQEREKRACENFDEPQEEKGDMGRSW